MEEDSSGSQSPAEEDHRQKKLRRPQAEAGSRRRASRALGRPPPPALVAGALLLSQIPEAEAAIPGTSLIGRSSLIAAMSVAIMTVRRTYDAVEIIIGTAEDKTIRLVNVLSSKSVDFVEAVGDESVRAVPFVGSVVIVLLLTVVSKNLLSMLWFDAKEIMKEQGENPEANVEERNFPSLPWLNADTLTRVSANADDAFTLTLEESSITSQPENDASLVYRVKSQTGNRHFTIFLGKSAIRDADASYALVPVQDRIRCTCPGDTFLRKGKDPDR